MHHLVPRIANLRRTLACFHDSMFYVIGVDPISRTRTVKNILCHHETFSYHKQTVPEELVPPVLDVRYRNDVEELARMSLRTFVASDSHSH